MISYYEVYQNQVYDLLESKEQKVLVFEDNGGKIKLKGLSQKVPFISDDLELECKGKDKYKCGSNVYSGNVEVVLQLKARFSFSSMLFWTLEAPFASLASMSFFDSTPSGRILNRASTDQSAVDVNIPPQIGAYGFYIIQLLGIIAVMSQVAWQVFIIFIPVIATCIWYEIRWTAPSARLSTSFFHQGVSRTFIASHLKPGIFTWENH